MGWSRHDIDICTSLPRTWDSDYSIISSFLLLLNIVNFILDRIVYCGLIGQVLLGVAWGTPGARWLSVSFEHAVVELGYLGLILIVYQGGLSTHLHSLKANLRLSFLVAIIGISLPIALSFTLRKLVPETTSLQAFAAGASLSSTSLGTTFTVLSTAGLTKSRLGIVLSTAAMMDDVVGLVMVQVISNLGGQVEAATIVRPVLVSIGFAIVVPVVCWSCVRPLTLKFVRVGDADAKSMVRKLVASRGAFFFYQVVFLMAMVTAASYAGTSNLFAAYLAGVVISWWSQFRNDIGKQNRRDTTMKEAEKWSTPVPQSAPREDSHSTKDIDTIEPVPLVENTPATEEDRPTLLSKDDECSGIAVYDCYCNAAVDYILRPMFFASIGFSIPITDMFGGAVVWRGIIYSALMIIGKLFCGVCLVRLTRPNISNSIFTRMKKVITSLKDTISRSTVRDKKSKTTNQAKRSSKSAPTAPKEQTPSLANNSPTSNSTNLQPLSLYPSAILGSAMVARGEIGFLISSIAESQGVFHHPHDSRPGSSTLFLVVNWAILLCTILGPLTVGLLVKRVRRLQEDERLNGTGRANPLGVWGVVTE